MFVEKEYKDKETKHVKPPGEPAEPSASVDIDFGDDREDNRSKVLR